jgi:hypothetical protein
MTTMTYASVLRRGPLLDDAALPLEVVNQGKRIKA